MWTCVSKRRCSRRGNSITFLRKNVLASDNTYKEPDNLRVGVHQANKLGVVARVAAKDVGNHESQVDGAEGEEKVAHTDNAENVKDARAKEEEEAGKEENEWSAKETAKEYSEN